MTLILFILLSLNINFTNAQTITTGSTVRPGYDITIDVSSYLGNTNGWVGFYKTDSQDRTYITFSYLRNLQGGRYTVKAPKELGTYNFRIFSDGGYNKIGESSSVQVVQYTPNLSTNKTTYLPNEKITVSYSQGSIFSGAWIGLSRQGTADNSYMTFKYTDASGQGTLDFNAPREPGVYEIRKFLDSGYTKIGSMQITVREFTPTLTPSRIEVNPGEKVNVSFTDGSTYSGAWIGVHRVGDPNTTYQSFRYTNATSGTLEFTMPRQVGTYEFRIYKDSGYTLIGTSRPVIVKEGSVSQEAPAPTPTPTPSPDPTPTPTPSQPGQTGVEVSIEPFIYGNRMSWGARPNVLGYRLFRSTTAGVQGISVTDFYINSTTYADVNVLPNTTYYYTVRPVIREANPLQGIEEQLGDVIASYTIRTSADIERPTSQRNFIILQLENPNLNMNGILSEIDPGRGTVPIIISGRTMVPIRAVVEAMGGEIDWEGSSQKITINARGNKIEVWIDKLDIYVNGVKGQMDVVPTIRDGRTYVPVRFIAENLNSKVDWINSTREAVIVFED